MVIDYLWPFFEPYVLGGEKEAELFTLLQYEKDPQQWKDVNTAIRFIRGMKSDHSQYQYQIDTLYLTCDKSMAEGFALRSYAGGEIGFITLQLINSLPLMQFDNWNPNESVSKAINQIVAFASSTPEPIVFTFNNLDIEDLLTDRDYKPQLNSEDYINYLEFHVVRYNKPIVLNEAEALPVNK